MTGLVVRTEDIQVDLGTADLVADSPGNVHVAGTGHAAADNPGSAAASGAPAAAELLDVHRDLPAALARVVPGWAVSDQPKKSTAVVLVVPHHDNHQPVAAAGSVAADEPGS